MAPFDVSRRIRQAAALICGCTVAFEYYSISNTFNFFSWNLLIHFIYFQLPLESRALPFLHSVSFIGASITPWAYGYLLTWKPNLENDNMSNWDFDRTSVIVRAVLVYFIPLVFHTLDVTSNLESLIKSYQTKSKRLMYLWSLTSYGLFGLIYELCNNDDDSLSNLDEESKRSYLRGSKILSFFVFILSYYILYSQILKRALPNAFKKGI